MQVLAEADAVIREETLQPKFVYATQFQAPHPPVPLTRRPLRICR